MTLWIDSIRVLFVFLIMVGCIQGRVTHPKPIARAYTIAFIGTCLVWLGTILQLSSNFESLNRFFILGNTTGQVIVANAVGYALGFAFVAVGVSQLMPRLASLTTQEVILETKCHELRNQVHESHQELELGRRAIRVSNKERAQLRRPPLADRCRRCRWRRRRRCRDGQLRYQHLGHRAR